jgi:flavin-dependent dehydrogenase
MMRFDALVIGGGPAGATAAILLARAGRSVAVLEKARFPRRKVCGEFIAASGLRLLQELGADSCIDTAGPDIRRIAVWGGGWSLEAPMPRSPAPAAYPRALEREALDTRLLQRARESGAVVHQPAVAFALERSAEGVRCRASARRGAPPLELQARIAIAAHGSWEPGALATQPRRSSPRGSDLLGFKAHFFGELPSETIVLRPFRGGYAGLVELGEGRLTFACCVRRDALERLRVPGFAAGDSVFRSCIPGHQRFRRDGPWLAAGPLRPGRRPLWSEGVFAIGNAATEVHPVVGEGISLAMHSARLLCAPLGEALSGEFSGARERAVAHAYARAWRRYVGSRLGASACLAGLVMHAPQFSREVLGRAPWLLTLAARVSGKR